ncbi:MAG: neutral zinc metallopeptidase [Rhodospirillaceae bacterium]|nr:neutral zinc metallopeptidase [Rhodospirillaceae bacterium]
MRWRGGRRSGNIIDRRGSGGGGLGGMGGLSRMRLPNGMGFPGGMGMGGGRGGIGRIVLIVGLLIAFSLLYQHFGTEEDTTTSGTVPAGQEELVDFVSVVLADTEDTWNAIFEQEGGTYREPQLVLFSGAVDSACGYAQAAVGPFYCPADQRVYIDLSFFDDLASRHNAAGDFAQAYVIAHEIGHHVQNLLGVLPEVHQRQQALPEAQANALSVATELQADCYAGIWAYHAQQVRQVLEPGDLQEALNAASAVGDDRLQRESQGRVVPDSFTHGTSQQRMEWFLAGFEDGELAACDTFGGAL